MRPHRLGRYLPNETHSLDHLAVIGKGTAMDEFHGQASVRVAARPRAVFGFITDVGRLQEWNTAIETVLAQPAALAEGAEWTVRMHPARAMQWGSISRVVELSPDHYRFAYQTRNADGNPSYSDWAWVIAHGGDSADVTVTWRVHLKTVDRKFFAGPIRKHQLAREVPRSLAALASAISRDTSRPLGR
jgi:PAS domain-containing protein